MDLNEFTPGTVKILINMFTQNSDKQKTMGTKILLNC